MYQYLRCGQDNIMLVNKDQDLYGDDIADLAGQGSLYLAQEEVSVSILVHAYYNYYGFAKLIAWYNTKVIAWYHV